MKPGSFQKRSVPQQFPPKEWPAAHEERRVPDMPGLMVSDRVQKPTDPADVAARGVAGYAYGPEPHPSPPVPPPAPPPPRRERPTRRVVAGGHPAPTTVASRIIRPVGAALVVVLLATLAGADTKVVTAPQGGAGACPFPGCRTTAGRVVVTDAPYNVSPGPADMSGRLQAAIDSGAAELAFPAGTYTVCNLNPRALNQRWVGAGPGQTILTGTAGCNNLIASSFGGVFSGPSVNFELSGFTFQGANAVLLPYQCRDTAAHIHIHDSAFDTGGPGCPTTTAGPSGISLTGCRDFVVENNEFYSSCPGSGGRGFLGAGIRGGIIQRNRSNWQRTFLEVSSTVNQPTEFTNVSDNVVHQTFWGIPTKYTNSGATVTYPGGVLTDTAATFAGLCDSGAASPCAAAAGNFVRAMTSKVAGATATFNTAGGMLTDAGQDFVAAGVLRGDIIRTTPICFGNGAGNNAQRFACTGAAGTGVWGDSCVCTATADCRSGICEPRWATVDTVGDLHNIQVDEWARDSACPLGSAICPTSSRRPTGAPLSTGGIAYTIYGWEACQLASYTGTTATCNTDGWFNWQGAQAAPAAGTLYEIMWTRPLYAYFTGATNAGTVQGARFVNNTASGGFADQFELTGSRFVVVDNHSRDCADTCFVFAGNQYTASNNIAEHCGARGFIGLGNDQTWTANVGIDSPWVRTSCTTSCGDFNVVGLRNTLAANKAIGDMPVNLNRFGYALSGTTTDTRLDGNTCAGTYSSGCYRFDGATVTATHVIGYHGETISNNAGTYAIEGGLATFAQVVTAALAPLNGSYVGCSDCTPASPCVAGGGGGSILKRMGAAWNCP